MSGKLYVIGTPIGNLGDISLRAIETLGKIDVLFCEDSRVSSKLINYLMEKGLITKKPRYVPYNEFNEDRIFAQIVQMVQDGIEIGLASDAGMPAISDPGYRAIRACLDASLPIEIIPGPTALTTALPWSGIGGEVMTYVGFLPKTSGKAIKILTAAKHMMDEVSSTRVVLYVSPHRLLKDLEHIKTVMGEVHFVLMRELTKQFEERVEGTTSQLIEKYTKNKVRGELVLVIGVSDRT
jgi:16S rRNA (cytidine1402-2'-O)-methyltransferase